VGREALAVLVDEQMPQHALRGGNVLRTALEAAAHPLLQEVRGRGLMLGMQLVDTVDAHEVVERLMYAGIITKDTYANTIRLSPPLNSDLADLEWGALRILEVLDEFVASTAPRPAAQHHTPVSV
jgi:ornithine--oxo-acid transaminase